MFIFCSIGPLKYEFEYKLELHNDHVDYVEIAVSGMRVGANCQCLYLNVMNMMKNLWTDTLIAAYIS